MDCPLQHVTNIKYFILDILVQLVNFYTISFDLVMLHGMKLNIFFTKRVMTTWPLQWPLHGRPQDSWQTEKLARETKSHTRQVGCRHSYHLRLRREPSRAPSTLTPSWLDDYFYPILNKYLDTVLLIWSSKLSSKQMFMLAMVSDVCIVSMFHFI